MELDTSRSLYNPSDYQECLNRINQLSADSLPPWGSMTAAQMLSHCSEIQEVSNGADLNGTPFIARLFKGMIRKMVVNEKPYKKSIQTHPQYRQNEDKDFETQVIASEEAREGGVERDAYVGYWAGTKQAWFAPGIGLIGRREHQ